MGESSELPLKIINHLKNLNLNRIHSSSLDTEVRGSRTPGASGLWGHGSSRIASRFFLHALRPLPEEVVRCKGPIAPHPPTQPPTHPPAHAHKNESALYKSLVYSHRKHSKPQLYLRQTQKSHNSGLCVTGDPNKSRRHPSY